MSRTASVAPISTALLLALSCALSAAQLAKMDWPQVVADLTTERSQALTCVGLIKSSGDSAAIDGAKMTYGSAKAEMDGVIAGLTTALVAGGQPEVSQRCGRAWRRRVPA